MNILEELLDQLCLNTSIQKNEMKTKNKNKMNAIWEVILYNTEIC